MLELIFSPLGPGNPRTGSRVVSLIDVEHPWPKILEVPTPLVPPVLLLLPTPLASSLRGCNRRPPGPPGTADSGWEIEKRLPLLIMWTVGKEHGPSFDGEQNPSSCS